MEVFRPRFTALQKSIFGAALVIFGLSLADCGQMPTSTPDPGTFGSVYQSIKTSNCVECHKPGGTATSDFGASLDFTSQTTSYSTLTTTNVTSTTSSAGCGTVKIVQANSPTTSYLMGALFSTYQIGFPAANGGCTPTNSHGAYHALTSSEEDSIKLWIQNGALNN